MMPVFNGADAATAPRTLYWQHEANAAIREGDWKLVTANDRDAGPWELYNLADDRSESQDLSGRHPQVAKRLREKWTRWAEEFDLKRYHDTVLSFGSPPTRYVRAMMLDLPIERA